MATEKRLIDANALSEAVSGIGKDIKRPRAVELACLVMINEAPTVDAVEVVRCEKCRYYEKAEYDEGYKMVCRLLKRQTASNGFCYCGERKDNDL